MFYIVALQKCGLGAARKQAERVSLKVLPSQIEAQWFEPRYYASHSFTVG
jgi:hypothetical protein